MNKYTKCGSYNLEYLSALGAVVEIDCDRRYQIGETKLPNNAVLLNDVHIGTINAPKNQWGEQPVHPTGAPLEYIVKRK